MDGGRSRRSFFSPSVQQASGHPPFLLALATCGLWVAAWSAARAGLRQYKARWLVELLDRFYTKDEYRDVYLAFDESKPELLVRIAAVVSGSSDSEAEWMLTRYLNFLEMVEALVDRGELTKDETKVAFQYPLDRLAKQDGMTEVFSEEWVRVPRAALQAAIRDIGRLRPDYSFTGP